MGYRPVSREPSKLEKKRRKQLEKLAKERNAYVMLLREYNTDGNTFMVDVTTEMIQDVDKRIAEVDPPTPPPPRGPGGVVPSRGRKKMPPSNPRLMTKRYMV